MDAWRANDPNWPLVSTVFVFGTGPTKAVGPSIMAEKKVIIPGSYAGVLASPEPVTKALTVPNVGGEFQETSVSDEKKSTGWPYVFYPATDYGTGMRLAIQAAWQLAPGRLAAAHESEDKCAYCAEPLVAGKTYLKNLQGMELGRDLIFPQTSNATDAQKIDDLAQAYFKTEIEHVLADPDYQPVKWVWSGNSVMSSSLLGQSLWKIQQQIDASTTIPAATKAKWKLRVIANNWGIGETTTKICGPACQHDNFYGLFPVPHFGDIQNSTRMPDLLALHQHFGDLDQRTPPPAPMPPRTAEMYRDVRYVQGYAAALMWEKGMRIAIAAGHKNPSGEDLKNALETFSNVDMDGITAATISFSAKDHRPQSGESIYKVDDNGQLVFVSKYNIPLVAEWLGY